MLWDEVILLAGDALAEDTSATDYFVQRKMRLWGAMSQLKVSRIIPCLTYDDDDGESIALVADQIMYTLPTDIRNIDAVRYEADETYLGYLTKRPRVADYPSDQPTGYFIQGKNAIGIYPAESSAGKYIYLFGTRLAVPYAFTLLDENSDSTACTFTLSGDSFSITITGGANAGTDTFDISDSDYDTVSELVAAINALGKNITARQNYLCPDDRACSDIEEVSSVDINSAIGHVFFNPEIDDELLMDVVLEEILAASKYKDKDPRTTSYHRDTAAANTEQHRILYEQRHIEAVNLRVNSINRPMIGRESGVGYGPGGRFYF